MKLTINGEEKIIFPFEKKPNLCAVIKELELNPKLIVLEFNGAILNPERWEEQIVQDGDILEIVTIVGGGSYEDLLMN